MNALSTSKVHKIKEPDFSPLLSFFITTSVLQTIRIWGLAQFKSLFFSQVGQATSCSELVLFQSMKGHCVRAPFPFSQLHVSNSQEADVLLGCP